MFGVTGASSEAEMIFLQYPVASVHCPKGNRLSGLPRYNMKCSRENVILRGIFNVVSGFPLHFMLYRENLDCFSNSACEVTKYYQVLKDRCFSKIVITFCLTIIFQIFKK